MSLDVVDHVQASYMYQDLRIQLRHCDFPAGAPPSRRVVRVHQRRELHKQVADTKISIKTTKDRLLLRRIYTSKQNAVTNTSQTSNTGGRASQQSGQEAAKRTEEQVRLAMIHSAHHVTYT